MNKKINIISILIIAISLIGTALSYGLYKENSDKLESTFVKVKDTNIVIHETFDGFEKENVYFSIDSDLLVYLRVKLTFNFLDDNGDYMSLKPIEGVDYTLSINNAWTYKNGYCFLEYPISSANTPVLINELKTLNANYKLVVDILIQTTNDLNDWE